ncbi:MAG: SIMPL domain-containing protein [Euryarchaeota archaeon]|nr:SIMPL domain-containing protein [Euryarchaeota archaeon]
MKSMAILLSLALTFLIPAVAAEDTFSLTVMGEGTVVVPADTVFVTVSVVSTDENVSFASAKNAEDLNRTIEALVDAGLDKDGILPGRGRSVQTIRTYTRTYNDTTSEVVAQEVTNRITEQVTIGLSTEDEGVLKRCLETAEAENASVEITGYGLSDAGPAMIRARRKAVEDARYNAGELASAAGLKLGKTVDIFEPSPPRVRCRYTDWDSFGPWMMNAFEWPSPHMYHSTSRATRTEESGMVEVISRVVVTYEVSP